MTDTMTLNLFGYETDGVPAPSDYELARPLTVTVATPWHYSFNGATRALSIGRDRFRFHTWCQRNPKVDVDRGCYSEDAWWEFYHHFVKDEDSGDLLDTQADALV